MNVTIDKYITDFMGLPVKTEDIKKIEAALKKTKELHKKDSELNKKIDEHYKYKLYEKNNNLI